MSDLKENLFILTYEYGDKSAFTIVGATTDYAVANAWRAASDGQAKVYTVQLDNFKHFSEGWEPWTSFK